MPILKPNHRQILAAKAVDGERTQYRIGIDTVPGLILDVRSSGKRTWFVRYQPGGRGNRKFRWFKIGDASVIGFRDAADRAEEIVKAVQKDNRDPHAERVQARRESKTFSDLFEDWHKRPRQSRRLVGLAAWSFARRAAGLAGLHRRDFCRCRATQGRPAERFALAHARSLGGALQIDMTAWFRATADNYFGRVKRDQILVAIDEANGSHAPALEKLKKSELAIRAEQLLADTARLLEPLRVAINDIGVTEQAEAAE